MYETFIVVKYRDVSFVTVKEKARGEEGIF